MMWALFGLNNKPLILSDKQLMLNNKPRLSLATECGG